MTTMLSANASLLPQYMNMVFIMGHTGVSCLCAHNLMKGCAKLLAVVYTLLYLCKACTSRQIDIDQICLEHQCSYSISTVSV